MKLSDDQKGWIGVVGLEILALIVFPPLGLTVLVATAGMFGCWLIFYIIDRIESYVRKR